jgi:hypothetical protein
VVKPRLSRSQCNRWPIARNVIGPYAVSRPCSHLAPIRKHGFSRARVDRPQIPTRSVT